MAKHTPPDISTLDSWKTFTKKIFKNWDADPGYYAIQQTPMKTSQRLRLAVAWCSFYNLGIAAKASEYQGHEFYDYLKAIYPTAKRASERRHFRGRAGMAALEQWQEKWPRPEALAEHMQGESYFEVRKKGQQVAQYGDYFYWKWCDLNEVLFNNQVDMTGSAKHSPKVPQQGAELIYKMTHPQEEDLWGVEQNVESMYNKIVDYGRRKHIHCPIMDREFGIAEAETVCCVYKQMVNGGYVYGSRTAKAVARLEALSSRTAQKMTETLLGLTPWTRDELKEILEKS